MGRAPIATAQRTATRAAPSNRLIGDAKYSLKARPLGGERFRDPHCEERHRDSGRSDVERRGRPESFRDRPRLEVSDRNETERGEKEGRGGGAQPDRRQHPSEPLGADVEQPAGEEWSESDGGRAEHRKGRGDREQRQDYRAPTRETHSDAQIHPGSAAAGAAPVERGKRRERGDDGEV